MKVHSNFTSSMEGIKTHLTKKVMGEALIQLQQSRRQGVTSAPAGSPCTAVGDKRPADGARIDELHGLKRKASPEMMPMGLCGSKRSRVSSCVSTNAIGINGDKSKRNASVTDEMITINDDGQNKMPRKFPPDQVMMGTVNQNILHTNDSARQVNDHAALLRTARNQNLVGFDRYGLPKNDWPQTNAWPPLTVMNQHHNRNGNTSLSAMENLNINYADSNQNDYSASNSNINQTSDERSDVKKERARPWTKEEDELLIQLVEKYGKQSWSKIARIYFTGRSGRHCSNRWYNDLDPDIKKGVWTEEEDKVIVQAHSEMGEKWAKIAKRLPGRNGNMIKNRWYAAGRKLDRITRSGRAGITQLHCYISSRRRSEACDTTNYSTPPEYGRPTTSRMDKKPIELPIPPRLRRPTPPALIPGIRCTESRPSPIVPTVQPEFIFATSANNFQHWGSDCTDQRQKYSTMLGPIQNQQTETVGVFRSQPLSVPAVAPSFCSNNSRPADRSCTDDLLPNDDVEARTAEIRAGGISPVLGSSCTDDQLQNVQEINLCAHPSQIEDNPMPIPAPLPETCDGTSQPAPVDNSCTDDQLQNNNFKLPDKLTEDFTPSTLVSESVPETFAGDYSPCFGLDDFKSSTDDPSIKCWNNGNYFMSGEDLGAQEQWDSDDSVMDLSLWS